MESREGNSPLSNPLTKPLRIMTIYSSRQDHAAFMALTWSVLADCADRRTDCNRFQQKFEASLHDAMGWSAGTVRDDEF